MKIVFFTDSFFPRKCGVTTYLTVTTQELLSRGHQVLIVAPKHRNAPAEKEMEKMFGCEIVLLPAVSARNYPDIRISAPTPASVFRVMRFQPDLIHFHTPGPIGLEGLLVAKALQVPLVSTFHTYFMEPEGFKLIGLDQDSMASPLLSKALWRLAARLHKPCNAIIAPTKYVADDLCSRWPKQLITTIAGGVQVEKFYDVTSRETLRDKYQIKPEELIILWVGRLSYEKSLDVILEALAIVSQRHPEAKLVMIGDGPAKESLEFLAQALGLEEKVIFAGSIDYKQLVDENYYAMADLFVTASTWDTQGLSIIEAMAAGLPVVAPNVKAMPELVEGIGELVEPNNAQAMAKAISKLLSDPQLRKDYSKRAKERAQKYSVESSVDELLELYDQLTKPQ